MLARQLALGDRDWRESTHVTWSVELHERSFMNGTEFRNIGKELQVWRGLRQTQAEETNLKLFKMNGGFLFEVLRLADCSGILGAFNQSGPLTGWS